MSTKKRQMLLASLVTLVSICTAQAETPDDLTDLVGARASSGETQMEARGYQLIRASRVRDQSWTFWWSDVQRQCVSISTVDGRYASLERIPASNCKADKSDGKAASSSVLPPSPPPSPSDVIALICTGEGRHVNYESHDGLQWNKDTKQYDQSHRLESGIERFNTTVEVEVSGDRGRIHLTGKMVPPIHSGGQDGWWTLEDVKSGPDRITGRYKLNFASSPTVEIDRHSGAIETKGIVSFSGRCERTGSVNEQRF